MKTPVVAGGSPWKFLILAVFLVGCLSPPAGRFKNPCDPKVGGRCPGADTPGTGDAGADARTTDMRGGDASSRLDGTLDAVRPGGDSALEAGAHTDARPTFDGGGPCTPGVSGPCAPELPDAGACATGVRQCDDKASWGPCEGRTEPTDETCNGLDDDCDGRVDEDMFGAPLAVPCFDGDPESAHRGVCSPGLSVCVGGALTACSGEVSPTTEVCDGLDNDCDGTVDNNVPCYDGPLQTRGRGTCADGKMTCEGGQPGACVGQHLPEPERCDDLDNDCDGVVDQYNQPCYDGPPDTAVAGRPCHGGNQVCVDGRFSECMGQVLPAAQEACDNRDDNCDGRVDESFDLVNDGNHCGACDNVCGAGQACCSRACRALDNLQNCGACGRACDRNADGCTQSPGAAGLACTCGGGPACAGGLRCSGGQCVCAIDDDCGPDALCCAGQCETTSATGANAQCAACGDGGCDPATAHDCVQRECRCGDGQACLGGATVCADRDGQGNFSCLGCTVDSQCGDTEICCGGVCEITNPNFQCQTCGAACDALRADTCTAVGIPGGHAMQCSCGAAGLPCDPNGPAPYCVAGACQGCRQDADCNAPGLGQCVAGVCSACDPADHAGCGPNDLCCEGACVGATPSGPGGCVACGERCAEGSANTCAGRTCGCGAGPPCGGQLPFCDAATGACVVCLADADCGHNPAGPVCVGHVCRTCDPNSHAGCGPNDLCCAAGPATYRCEVTSADGGGECAACGQPCDTHTSNLCSGRACGCGAHPACAGATPVCDDAHGVCVQCVADVDCAGNPGGGQCVNNACRACDPADHTGCAVNQLCCPAGGGPPQCQATSSGVNGQCAVCGVACPQETTSACLNRSCMCGANAPCVDPTPVCNHNQGRCMSCRVDQDCPNGQCVAGACQACDPADNAGCVASGNTPVCNAATMLCRGCAIDGECANNANGGQCVAGKCGQCDPAGGQCGPATPTCDAATLTCRACVVDPDCAAYPNLSVCSAGRCKACDPGTSVGCDEASPTPICDAVTASCRACSVDADCLNRSGNRDQCVAGFCQACDVADNAGCVSTGTTPICANVGGTATCVGCTNDLQCGPAASQCVTLVGNPDRGACRVCDPADSTGCNEGAANPICAVANGIYACTPCTVDLECSVRAGAFNQCVAGRCRGCDPANDEGCNAASTTPHCNVATFSCANCQNDAQCATNPNGGQCISNGPGQFRGSCKPCDSNDSAGCAEDSDAPICSAAFACGPCVADADCVSRVGTLNECVANHCRACDPVDNASCVAGSAAPICDGTVFQCRGCTDNTECSGNPTGNICGIALGGAPACIECAQDSDCVDAGYAVDSVCVGSGPATCL